MGAAKGVLCSTLERIGITFVWKVTRLPNTVRPSPGKRAGVVEAAAWEKRSTGCWVGGTGIFHSPLMEKVFSRPCPIIQFLSSSTGLVSRMYGINASYIG